MRFIFKLTHLQIASSTYFQIKTLGTSNFVLWTLNIEYWILNIAPSASSSRPLWLKLNIEHWALSIEHWKLNIAHSHLTKSPNLQVSTSPSRSSPPLYILRSFSAGGSISISISSRNTDDADLAD